jgi:hypothetical protein
MTLSILLLWIEQSIHFQPLRAQYCLEFGLPESRGASNKHYKTALQASRVRVIFRMLLVPCSTKIHIDVAGEFH